MRRILRSVMAAMGVVGIIYLGPWLENEGIGAGSYFFLGLYRETLMDLGSQDILLPLYGGVLSRNIFQNLFAHGITAGIAFTFFALLFLGVDLLIALFGFDRKKKKRKDPYIAFRRLG